MLIIFDWPDFLIKTG